MDFVTLIKMAGQFILAVAMTFALLALLTSFLRFQWLQHRLKTLPPEAVDPEKLLSLQIIQRLSKVQRGSSSFCVGLVRPADFDATRRQHGEAIAGEIATAIEQQLRNSIRKGDYLVRYKDDMLGIVADIERTKVSIMARRIVQTLSTTTYRCSNGLAIRVPVHAGFSTFPDDEESAQPLIDQAEQSLRAATASGTNQFRLTPDRPAPDAATGAADPAEQDARDILDELTGVLSERHMSTAMQKYVARHRKEHHPVSVIYLSVDYFSQYVDHYGQQASDMILKGLAMLLTERTRETDLIARSGASGFLLTLNAGPRNALGVAQRIISDVKKLPIRIPSTSLRITVSAGVASAPEHGNGARHLYEASRIALHGAQDKGKSMALVYHAQMRKERPRERPVDTF